MRTWNAAAQALLARLHAGEQIPMVQLVELQLEVTQRYATAGVPLVWGGFEWAASPLSVSAVEDSATDLGQLVLSLPAVTEAQLAIALVDDVEGRTVVVYDAIVDPDTGAVADARRAWTGVMDVPSIEDGPQGTLAINCEHRGTVALRPRPQRYTDEEQQRLFPGDRMFDQDPATDADGLVWPAASYFKV